MKFLTRFLLLCGLLTVPALGQAPPILRNQFTTNAAGVVTGTTPGNGEFMTYSGASGKWTNSTGGSVTSTNNQLWINGTAVQNADLDSDPYLTLAVSSGTNVTFTIKTNTIGPSHIVTDGVGADELDAADVTAELVAAGLLDEATASALYHGTNATLTQLQSLVSTSTNSTIKGNGSGGWQAGSDNNAGSTTWTTIGNPTANSTNAFGTNTVELRTSDQGFRLLRLRNEDTDATASTGFMDMIHNDIDDVDIWYLRLIADADGTPTTDYEFNQTVMAVRPPMQLVGALTVGGASVFTNSVTIGTTNVVAAVAGKQPLNDTLSAASTNTFVGEGRIVLETASTGTDDQTAAEVPVTPFGSIAANDVQEALEEIVAESAGGGDVMSDGSVPMTGLLQLTATGVTNHPLPVIDVTAFGADPTDVSDSTAAIQAAIDYADSNGNGGIVFIPAGTYRINGTIWARTNAIIRGASTAAGHDGHASFLYKRGAGNAINLLGPRITIEGVSIYSDHSGLSGISTTNSIDAPYLTIRNVSVNSFTNGLFLSRSWVNLIENSHFTKNLYGIRMSNAVNATVVSGGYISANTNGVAIDSDSCYANTFLGVTFEGNVLGASITDNAFITTFQGNHFESNDQDLHSDGSYKIKIDGNLFNRPTDSVLGLFITNSHVPTVVNNVFNNTNLLNIVIDSASTNSIVTGNYYGAGGSTSVGDTTAVVIDNGAITLGGVARTTWPSGDGNAVVVETNQFGRPMVQLNDYDIGPTNQFNVDTINAGTLNLTNPIPALKVSFDDTPANYASGDLENVINELATNNASGPNASDGKVSWTQLLGVPAGFADGSDNTDPGGAISLISEDGTPLTQRTNLNFIGAFTAVDNAGNDRTDVSLDADLEDLADGELSGGKVGSGIIATNITVGTIPTNVLDPLVVLAQGGQIGGTGQAPTVLGITESDGPTALTFGAIADGQTLQRSGTTVIGVTAGASADYTLDIADEGGSNIYTNSPATNTTFFLSAKVMAGGSTNRAAWHKTVAGHRDGSAPTLFTADTPFFGTTSTTELNTTNLLWQVSGNTVVLTAWGVNNGLEPTHWQASDVQSMSTTNMLVAAGGGGSFTGDFDESFEGAETGYDNAGWAEFGTGTVDQDYTGVVLAGTESLRFVTSTTTAYAEPPDYASTNEVYYYFKWRPVTTQTANRSIVNVLQSTTARSNLRRETAGTIRVLQGSVTATTVGTITAGTTYHVWGYYKKSTASNGEAWVAFSTDGVLPTSGDNFAAITTGDATVDVDGFQIGLITTGVEEGIIDDVRINLGNKPIGDNGNDP